jgi:enoyl-CoA hydratase/carnithine racemase
VTHADAAPPVAFAEIAAASGHRIGRVRLSRPRRMNALDRGICTSMIERLRAWASDESIVCVVVDGDGDKGFCAGGDVVTAAREIRSGGPRRYAYGDALFPDEYRIVRLLHDFPKPVLTWAHGVTMGAGMGLAASGSHRVVSPGASIAMPEIRIGLFPDVGAAWLLDRTPARSGLLVAMAGLALDDVDALFVGLADWSLPFAERDAVYDALTSIRWLAHPRRDAAALSALLDRLAARSPAEARVPPLAARLDAIRAICRATDVAELQRALAAAGARDPWFGALAANLAAGAPFAACVTFEHLRRARKRSLADTLDTDTTLIKAMIRRDDFVEGVRAQLIDKDRSPAWSPPRVADVSSAEVLGCFGSP